MARLLQTTADIISAVRAQLSETNTDAVSDAGDLLPALNRAQDYATSILARYYPDPLVTYTSVSLTGGVAEYTIPEDAFEDRIEKIEMSVGSGIQRELLQINYQDISNYETSGTTNVPAYFAVVGRKYRMVPTPSGTYNARLWYIRQPDSLVASQGRVVIINSAANYVILDNAGEDLSTTSDLLSSYINMVDGQTGIVKATYQILSIVGSRVTIRTTPLRTTVLGKTVSTSIAGAPIPIEQDDYICLVQGTCVVQSLGSTVSNFLIQYAVCEIARKLGGEVPSETELLDHLEKQVQRTYTGREVTLRVRKRSQIWGPLNRKWWGPRTS